MTVCIYIPILDEFAFISDMYLESAGNNSSLVFKLFKRDGRISSTVKEKYM